MACGQQEQCGLCSGAGGASKGSRKESYTSKVCYPRCTKAQTDLCQGISYKPRTGPPSVTCFMLGMSAFGQCCVVTLVSLGWLRAAMEASPELVKFSTWLEYIVSSSHQSCDTFTRYGWLPYSYRNRLERIKWLVQGSDHQCYLRLSAFYSTFLYKRKEEQLRSDLLLSLRVSLVRTRIHKEVKELYFLTCVLGNCLFMQKHIC